MTRRTLLPMAAVALPLAPAAADAAPGLIVGKPGDPRTCCATVRVRFW